MVGEELADVLNVYLNGLSLGIAHVNQLRRRQIRRQQRMVLKDGRRLLVVMMLIGIEISLLVWLALVLHVMR